MSAAKTPAQSAKPFDAAKFKADKEAKEAKDAKTKPAATPSKAGSAAPSAAGGEDPAKVLEQLNVKTKAVNANNVARVANSQLTANTEKLHPLVSLKNGKALEKFPEMSKDIEKLSLTNVDMILNALEADRSGNEAAKKERLRVQIGLPANPA